MSWKIQFVPTTEGKTMKDAFEGTAKDILTRLSQNCSYDPDHGKSVLRQALYTNDGSVSSLVRLLNKECKNKGINTTLALSLYLELKQEVPDCFLFVRKPSYTKDPVLIIQIEEEDFPPLPKYLIVNHHNHEFYLTKLGYPWLDLDRYRCFDLGVDLCTMEMLKNIVDSIEQQDQLIRI